MSTLCLFLLLCGGGAYAASRLAKNTVGTAQIRNGAVTKAKISSRAQAALKGKTGPRGLPGASHGFQATGSSSSLSASLYGSALVTLALPPGAYFVMSTVSASTSDAMPGSISCRLISGTGGTGSEGTSSDQDLPAGSEENFTLAAEFKIAAGQGVTLECSRSGPTIAVQSDANVVAVQITDVTGSP